MRLSPGIRGQLVAGIVVTTLAAIGFLGVISVFMLQNGAVYAKVYEAVRVAKLMRSALLADTFRERDLERRAGAFMADAGIASLELLDRSGGRVVFRGGRAVGERGSLVLLEDGIRVYREGGGLLEGPGGRLRVEVGASPLRPSSGRASFTLPLADVASYTSNMRWFIIFYAAVDSAIIIALGVYFISVFMVRPLRKLEGAASRIAGGDLDVRAEVTGSDEVGRLAGAFNTMAERLEDEIKRLGRLNAELVETQEELLRASTLASVGRLAAGIAHEVGNPLGAVSGYLDILGKGGLDEGEQKGILERAGREVARMNGLLREFLDLSRSSPGPPERVSVNPLVEETVSVVAHHEGFEGVRIELELKEGLPPVIIDADKLRQVFMNLLINAASAVAGSPGEGVITVESGVREEAPGAGAARRKGDPEFSTGAGRRRVRRLVTVAFRDTGGGISPEEMDKIFEPFFTTKEPGKGTGMGLFVSQGIIRNYGGAIEAASGPERGSVFTVTLPAAPEGEEDEGTGS